MMAETILYQNGAYTVRKAPNGYEVYADDGVAARRVAQIGNGPGPSLGLQRAIAEADKRARGTS